MGQVIRISLMLLVLAGGTLWMRPRTGRPVEIDVRFTERAQSAGCLNVHTMVQLAAEFENIMPWLSSVGAAAAAGDFDADGYADIYVINSGRGDSNRLFRNRGDGTFEDVTAQAGVGCGNPEGGSMHAIWGDIDNDGDLDLYVVKWGEANTLFRNDSRSVTPLPGREGLGEGGTRNRLDTPTPGPHAGPHPDPLPEGEGVRFTDITVTAGVGYWGYANGATFLDYDRDGHLDILVGNYFAEKIEDPQTRQMVRNNLWHPVSTKVMHETFTHADNGGRNVLYRNRGDGTFEDVTEALGLTYTGWTLAVGAGDLNNDGWPDLYLANDFGPDEYYLNTGATENPPRFRLVVDPRGHPGVGNDWWKGMNVDLGDVNNDGYLDIYVTNIFAKHYKTDEGNMLWINCVDPLCPGGRGFRNVGESSGTFDGGWGWGGKFADFNNDGLLDIFTVNGFVTGDPDATYWFHLQEMVTQTKNQTADARDWPTMGPRDLSGHELGRLFIQSEPGAQATGPNRENVETSKHQNVEPSEPRTDLPLPLGEGRGEGLARADLPRGVNVAALSSEPRALARAMSRSEQTPHFVEVAEQAGITDTFNGRGIALADFNLDGAIDIYIANQGAPSCYYVNQGRRSGHRPDGPDVGSMTRPTDRAFIRMKLVGRPEMGIKVGDRTLASTRDAVGARVTLHTRNGIQMREVQGGTGFAGQSEYPVHFGIPDPSAVERITIRWPSGREQVFEVEQARALLNRHVQVTEGSGAAADRP